MPKIICEWMMCKHNTSNTPEEAGECTTDVVYYRHFDNDGCECLTGGDPDFVEVLQCEAMELDPGK